MKQISNGRETVKTLSETIPSRLSTYLQVYLPEYFPSRQLRNAYKIIRSDARTVIIITWARRWTGILISSSIKIIKFVKNRLEQLQLTATNTPTTLGYIANCVYNLSCIVMMLYGDFCYLLTFCLRWTQKNEYIYHRYRNADKLHKQANEARCWGHDYYYFQIISCNTPIYLWIIPTYTIPIPFLYHFICMKICIK